MWLVLISHLSEGTVLTWVAGYMVAGYQSRAEIGAERVEN